MRTFNLVVLSISAFLALTSMIASTSTAGVLSLLGWLKVMFFVWLVLEVSRRYDRMLFCYKAMISCIAIQSFIRILIQQVLFPMVPGMGAAGASVVPILIFVQKATSPFEILLGSWLSRASGLSQGYSLFQQWSNYLIYPALRFAFAAFVGILISYSVKFWRKSLA